MQASLPAHWSLSVVEQGEEREPVVVIDGFSADPERLIGDASFLAFRPIGPHYPGIRAEVPSAMLDDLLAPLAPIVAEIFGESETELLDAYYSLVTTRPPDLAPIQRLPHFDGVERERLALLHYLARDERSGTAFYRHRTTGFETVNAARLAAYRTALDADLRREGMPPPEYIAGNTPIFEQVAVHHGRFNRAILYRSNTLHCAFLPPDLALSADPLAGRLTINTFLAGRRRG
jgi:hypothetical protein